jgi:hypothetical protein
MRRQEKGLQRGQSGRQTSEWSVVALDGEKLSNYKLVLFINEAVIQHSHPGHRSTSIPEDKISFLPIVVANITSTSEAGILGSTAIYIHVFLTSALVGDGQLHAPAALPPKSPR